MSVLALKELSASNAAHEPLLALFQQCREHVLHVAATHLLPDHVAVTTQNGFVELVNIATGEFRLFLTYLNHIPLDSALRCFSLVPSLYAASRGSHHYLAYSLAFSNELLLADMNTGALEVLGSFHSRPSTTFCDGDYIACGEGCGQVCVWRASTSDNIPRALWRLPLFEDAVVCIRIHRSQLVCCSADYRCLVVDVDCGSIVTRLAQAPDRAVAVLPLVKPLVHNTVLALCVPTRISVYASPSSPSKQPVVPDAGTADVKRQSGEGKEGWLYVGGCPMADLTSIQCATCFGGYLAAGTASGVVLLFHCDAVSGAVEELVRFDVGFGVVGLQLYGNGMLLVVTSAGDVWKWLMKDLLASPSDGTGAATAADDGTHANESEGGDDGEEGPVPSALQPQPIAGPSVATTDEDIVDTPAEAVAELDIEMEEDLTTVPARKKKELEGDERRASTAAAGDGEDPPSDHSVTQIGEEDCEERQPQQQKSPAPHGKDGHKEGGDVSVSAVEEGEYSVKDDGKRDSPLRSPEEEEPLESTVPANNDDNSGDDDSEPEIVHVECSASTADTSSSASFWAAQSRSGTTATNNNHNNSADARSSLQPLVVIPTEPTGLTSRQVQKEIEALERQLGPAVVIEGLRKGKRMDPRAILSVLGNAAVSKVSGSHLHDSDNEQDGAPIGVTPHSAALLEEQLTKITHAEFDPGQYALEHPLEAAALLYEHPVIMPTFHRHAQVLGDVRARIEDGGPGQAKQLLLEGGATSGEAGAAASPAQDIAYALPSGKVTRDDLADVNYGRVSRKIDPEMEEERRLGGPDILQHHCENLLYPSYVDVSSTVLFRETRPDLTKPKTLRLPMPLPPTSSVF